MTGYDSFVGRHAMELWNEIIKDDEYKLYNGTYKPNKRFELLVHKGCIPIMVRSYRTKEAANEVAREAIRRGWKVEGRKI